MKHHLLLVSGFGNKGLNELNQTIHEEVDIETSQIFQGCPFWLANSDPNKRIQAIEKVIQSLPKDYPTILVAHSYGSLLALLAACRLRFQGIDHAFFIDPPINPDYELQTPKNKPLFKIFARQYRNREILSKEAESYLQNPENESEIQSKNHHFLLSPSDRIVPYQSQLIKSAIDKYDFSENVKGHALTPTKIQETVRIIIQHLQID